MNAVTEHEASEDQRRDHLEIRNIANLKEYTHLSVPAKKDYSPDHQEKKTRHLQKEFMEGPEEVLERRLQRFDHRQSQNSRFQLGIITHSNLKRAEPFRDARHSGFGPPP